MGYEGKAITILSGDDEADDRMMASEALEDSRLANDLRSVEDGEELMDYLYRHRKYAETDAAPRPGLILPDLNMTGKDGRKVLKKIKSDPDLRLIPVIVLRTSKAEKDIYRTHNLDINSFMNKSVLFTTPVEVIRTLGKYWFEIVELPSKGTVGAR